MIAKLFWDKTLSENAHNGETLETFVETGKDQIEQDTKRLDFLGKEKLRYYM